MKYTTIIANVCALVFLIQMGEVRSIEEQNQVCSEVGELVHGDQKKCVKGDLIMLNPMLAAYLCDLSKSHIMGDKIIICHYLGYKRQDRK